MDRTLPLVVQIGDLWSDAYTKDVSNGVLIQSVELWRGHELLSCSYVSHNGYSMQPALFGFFRNLSNFSNVNSCMTDRSHSGDRRCHLGTGGSHNEWDQGRETNYGSLADPIPVTPRLSDMQKRFF